MQSEQLSELPQTHSEVSPWEFYLMLKKEREQKKASHKY